jgi:hypothetical protein
VVSITETSVDGYRGNGGREEREKGVGQRGEQKGRALLNIKATEISK